MISVVKFQTATNDDEIDAVTLRRMINRHDIITHTFNVEVYGLKDKDDVQITAIDLVIPD